FHGLRHLRIRRDGAVILGESEKSLRVDIRVANLKPSNGGNSASKRNAAFENPQFGALLIGARKLRQQLRIFGSRFAPEPAVEQSAGMSEALFERNFLITGFQSGAEKIQLRVGLPRLLNGRIAEIEQLIVLDGLQRTASLLARLTPEKKQCRLGLRRGVSVQGLESSIWLI